MMHGDFNRCDIEGFTPRCLSRGSFVMGSSHLTPSTERPTVSKMTFVSMHVSSTERGSANKVPLPAQALRTMLAG